MNLGPAGPWTSRAVQNSGELPRGPRSRPPNLDTCRWYLAQQYVSAPLLINGCKFGVRVWVLVPELVPLRAYMHLNGLVLFSSER